MTRVVAMVLNVILRSFDIAWAMLDLTYLSRG